MKIDIAQEAKAFKQTKDKCANVYYVPIIDNVFFTNHDVTWFANNYVEFNPIISILEAECQDTSALGFYLIPSRRLRGETIIKGTIS